MLKGIVSKEQFREVLKKKHNIVDNSYDDNIDKLYEVAVSTYIEYGHKDSYEDEEVINAAKNLDMVYGKFKSKVLADRGDKV